MCVCGLYVLVGSVGVGSERVRRDVINTTSRTMCSLCLYLVPTELN